MNYRDRLEGRAILRRLRESLRLLQEARRTQTFAEKVRARRVTVGRKSGRFGHIVNSRYGRDRLIVMELIRRNGGAGKLDKSLPAEVGHEVGLSEGTILKIWQRRHTFNIS